MLVPLPRNWFRFIAALCAINFSAFPLLSFLRYYFSDALHLDRYKYMSFRRVSTCADNNRRRRANEIAAIHTHLSKISLDINKMFGNTNALGKNVCDSFPPSNPNCETANETKQTQNRYRTRNNSIRPWTWHLRIQSTSVMYAKRFDFVSAHELLLFADHSRVLDSFFPGSPHRAQFGCSRVRSREIFSCQSVTA